jgi:hypothetical protein
VALPPEAWETLAFTVLPSLRRLTLEFDIPQAWQRREEVEPGNLEVERAARPVRWAIWRPKLISNFRSLDEDDAALLDALADGRTFPELCEAIAPFTGEEQAPARTASLLRAWVEGGLIAGFRHEGLVYPRAGRRAPASTRPGGFRRRVSGRPVPGCG